MHAGRLTLTERFERALGAILARVRFGGSPMRIALAYSGGLDSSVLLHLLAHRFAGGAAQLHAFHIHHGLSPHADAWQAHCAREAARHGVVFDTMPVAVRNDGGRGIEAAARDARYAALGELCRRYGIALLLTAHHQDDQAETVLIQLLRGTAIAGLRGMDDAGTAPDLLGDDSTVIGRPLLDCARHALAAHAERQGIRFIVDESNADMRYARNAVRGEIFPAIERHFPGSTERIVRTARHARATQELLDALADQDLAGAMEDGMLRIATFAGLDPARIDNLLRRWLQRNGLDLPSSAWLGELRHQVLAARDDAQVCVSHPGGELRRYRGLLALVAHTSQAGRPENREVRLAWRGESVLDVPAFGGRLHFDAAEEGIGAERLRQATIVVRTRRGGDKVKLAPNRPARSLKQHYQAFGIPAWERARLPLIDVDGMTACAAGIGMDCRAVDSVPGPKIRLRWESKHS